MFCALILATALLLAATLLPLSRHSHWVIRDLDFPKVQIAVVACVLLITQWLLLDHDREGAVILMVLTAACAIGQLWWILPYTRLWPTESQNAVAAHPDRTLKIITANVLATNRNAAALLDIVRANQPDVLVTLESNAWWQKQLEALEGEMPYTIKCPLENLYGMHVYSRLPIQEAAIEYLVEPDVPSMHAQFSLRCGDKVRMHFLHPAPPSPTENTESVQRDAELIVVARSVADSDQPLVVTGDLNDVAWSATTRLFRKISGLLDPRVGRGLFSTFHAKILFMRWPLDHLFHSRHFTVKSIERLPAFGSDHFALLGELVFNPGEPPGHRGPSPSAKDETLARDMARAQGVIKDDVPRPGD